ncbi:MAG: hypothetical protein H3C49_00370 [Alphaproteobacteria bacterium]|nr:hypothetical protein [Alphaproteobacteria bacterium]
MTKMYLFPQKPAKTAEIFKKNSIILPKAQEGDVARMPHRPLYVVFGALFRLTVWRALGYFFL